MPEDHGGDLTGKSAVGTFKSDGVTPIRNDELPSCARSAAKRRPKRS